MYTLSLVYTLSVPCAGLHMIAPLKKRKGCLKFFLLQTLLLQVSNAVSFGAGFRLIKTRRLHSCMNSLDLENLLRGAIALIWCVTEWWCAHHACPGTWTEASRTQRVFLSLDHHYVQ